MVKSRQSEKDIYTTSVDAIKWIATTAITVLALIFGGLATITAINFNIEKKSIEELKNKLEGKYSAQIKRIDEIIYSIDKTANVVVYKEIGKVLDGETIEGKIVHEDNKNYLQFNIIMKNIGSGKTDTLFIKTYITDSLNLGKKGISSDEMNFQYELITDPASSDLGKLTPSILPAGASSSYTVKAELKGENKIGEKYPILMKVYFGGKESNNSYFNMILTY